MKWWPEQCDKGDMVRVRIGGIWHYGVYISDAEVIQFGYPPREALPPDADVRVVSTTIDEFAGGSIVERARLSLTEKLKRIPPEKTTAIARGRFGEGNYNLIHNNCEHFAFECVFGVHRSEQEENAKKQWNEYISRHPK
ncbi:MAG: lecithin retinol acyltransferase family protein [Clostridia bacterium]|nr:lecithin retinol acyltransferase family protein [Clostridia bacterium]